MFIFEQFVQDHFWGEGGGVGKDVFAVWKSLVGIVGSMMMSFRPKTHRINGWS